MPQFAANLSMLYPELNFLDRFAAARQDRFTAVEFLAPYPYAASDLRRRLQDNHLKLVLINTPPGGANQADIEAAWNHSQRGTACVPGQEAAFRFGLEAAVDYAQALDCPRIHVMAGLIPENVSREAAQATYIENLKWACERVKGIACELLIEPINTRDIPGFFLNRQDHAHQIIEAVGSDKLKVQMDLYHCQIVEGDVAMKLRKYLPTRRVGHIQIAGVPERHEPDIGEMNYPYLFNLIDELGFAGWVGCEYKPKLGQTPGGTSKGLAWFNKN